MSIKRLGFFRNSVTRMGVRAFSAFVALALGARHAAAYTASNSPYMPGNWNLPAAGTEVFGADVAKSLPEIYVRFQLPEVSAQALAADVESTSEIDSRIHAIAQELAADKNLIGMMAPSSFLRKGDADIFAALNSVKGGSGSAGFPGMEAWSEFMEGVAHSPRPHVSQAATASGCC
ncbi:unnamed protein product [Amoebophrya sp. A25]|nr:unnamed protein product [Amoebophrya sp. A25]|eukprot:GSA25T00026807001.1